ncbi:hypothetical protein SAMN05444008_11571 [Cnuella takakiae]|uniref:MetA-pathway of phenol degradation n=1 Tax=Cnuella takakiae TaxID=1302690 RepID=A0A1M5G268_9BACT|nr:hypothetical protein [Cnuella takakiae]OLY92305.1 hypothetical protein BUE76_10665 [Cnuella takakiae]SHF97865.1 hypothetical protein SAMN05444008_11571 [Cnuella takakiae]
MKPFLFFLLLLPFLALAQAGTVPAIKEFPVPIGRGGGSGLTQAQRDSIRAANIGIADLNTRMDGKKDIDPNEIPFTQEHSATIENLKNLKIVPADSVQRKTDLLDAGRIFNTVPVDSLYGIGLHSNFSAKAFRYLGSRVKAFTLTCSLWESGDSTMATEGSLRLHAVILDRDTVVSKIGFRQYRQGDYTAGTMNAMGIYRLNSTLDTLFLVANTNNNPDLYKGVNRTDVTEPLTASVILKAGAYYAGYIHTRTAAVMPPSMCGDTGDGDVPERWGGSLSFAYHLTGTTTFPAFIKVSSLSVNKDKRLIWFE